MKKVLFSLFVLYMFFLVGCDTEQNYEIGAINFIEETHIFSSVVYYATGILYKPNTSSGFYYYDYNSGVNIPLCSDVNCSHNYNVDKDCAGIFRTDNIFAYKNKLYYVEEDHFSNNENVLTDFYLSTSELDGTARKRKLFLGRLHSIGAAYLYNNVLYLCANEGYYLDGEDLGLSPEHIKAYILEVNMETFEIYKSDIFVDGGNDSFIINGRLGNKLCLDYNNMENWTEFYYDFGERTIKSSSYYPEQSSHLYCGELAVKTENFKPIEIENVKGEIYKLPDDISHIVNRFANGTIFFVCESDTSRLYYFNPNEWNLYISKPISDMVFFENGSVADIWGNYLIIRKSTELNTDYERIPISEMEFSEYTGNL